MELKGHETAEVEVRKWWTVVGGCYKAPLVGCYKPPPPAVSRSTTTRISLVSITVLASTQGASH